MKNRAERRKQLEDRYERSRARLHEISDFSAMGEGMVEAVIRLAAIDEDYRMHLDRAVRTLVRLHGMAEGGDGY